MTADACPTTPLIPAFETRSSLDRLPSDARELYERPSRSCTLLEAAAFMGMDPKTYPKDDGTMAVEPSGAAYKRAKRYAERTQSIRRQPVYDPWELLPEQYRGEWIDIPATKCGGYSVNTRMLVWMKYAWVSPW